ncbi:MAG TPA: glycosyltransferase family 39 protein [Solirubrobacteraceae bacterium]|jgi:4-amino-4-deoxy-L-arabinose transferase-like glycosyltransferase
MSPASAPEATAQSHPEDRRRSASPHVGRISTALRRGWHSGWFAAALVVLGAAWLRLAHLGAVVSDPFYDAAVRSMTLSWHDFFFGAVEPSGAVAIDKPPVDLWLQVASVKLFGWGSATLKLPQALAGTAAVAFMFAALRRVFGLRAALAGALALAVLPIEVITARSDTMDAVMMALMALALLLGVRATETGRSAWLLGAAAALGLAFNIKLLESLPALPPLVLLAWLGLPGRRRRRLAQIAAAGAVYVAVSLAWLGATLLYPTHERPYAYGSTNGSAWNSAFVFNGLDRLEGKAVEGPQQGFVAGHHYPQNTQAEREEIPIVPPSATRLLARIGPLSGERLGLEALAGLMLGGALLFALLRGRASPERRLRLALAASLMLWLAIGVALFSDMARLHPRYTEALAPAVAGTLGIGVAWATERRTRGRLLALSATLIVVVIYSRWLLFGTPAVWWIAAFGAAGALAVAWPGRAPAGPRAAAVLALSLLCLLAIPLSGALRGVRDNVSDTNRLGVLHAGELGPLSAYLRAHQGSAYYEAAFDSGTKMGELVVQDARPILVLSTLNGRVFTPVARLRALATEGRVRYALINTVCGPHSTPANAACTAPARWVVAHGVDVSRAAGLPRGGMLWRLP